MNLIDTHAHLDLPQFKGELKQIIQNAKNAGVNKIINIGCNTEHAKKAIKLAEQFENIYAAVGIHPDDVDEKFDEKFKIIEELASHPKIVAIGECGFDLFKKRSTDFNQQKIAFEKHIELAQKLNKPLVVHLRDCKTKSLKFLKNSTLKTQNSRFPNFVIHCFSEDLEFANEIIDLGGMISFTGIVTFPNAIPVQETAAKIPLKKIILETDSPFLAPQKYRGKRCEPAYVREIAKEIAELRGISLEEIAKVTTKNAEEFFCI